MIGEIIGRIIGNILAALFISYILLTILAGIRKTHAPSRKTILIVALILLALSIAGQIGQLF